MSLIDVLKRKQALEKLSLLSWCSIIIQNSFLRFDQTDWRDVFTRVSMMADWIERRTSPQSCEQLRWYLKPQRSLTTTQRKKIVYPRDLSTRRSDRRSRGSENTSVIVIEDSIQQHNIALSVGRRTVKSPINFSAPTLLEINLLSLSLSWCPLSINGNSPRQLPLHFRSVVL